MIISNLILIAKILLISYFVTRFEPVQWVIESLPKKIKDNILFNIFYLAITCFKCSSFWIGLIMSHNFYIATIAFIIAFIYDKKFSLWETKISFK